MIKGLFETHIGVRDLEHAMAFYEDVIGLELAMKEESRRIAFYWIGGRGHAMLGLWEKPKDKVFEQHFAFEIETSDMDAAIANLQSKNVATYNFFGEATQMPIM